MSEVVVQKYVVRLEADERTRLEVLIGKGKHPAATAHAFGVGKPNADLFLSPDHSVFFNGSLFPVRSLGNGTIIAQERTNKVTYCHVELLEHDVIVAQGLSCESNLNIGDRSHFGNCDRVVHLLPDLAPALITCMAFWDACGCAPLIVCGPELDAVRSFVNAQATIGAQRTVLHGFRLRLVIEALSAQGDLIHCRKTCRAVQTPRRAPSSHPEASLSGRELAGI